MTQQVFYRNNRFLTFKVFKDIEDAKDLLPTVIIYANNGQFVYQPYVFKEVEYVQNSINLNNNFDFYFALVHELHTHERKDSILQGIRDDLKTGYYFPFGEIIESLFNL